MKKTLILVLAMLWISLVCVAIVSDRLKPITKIVEVLREVAVDEKDIKLTVVSDTQYEMLLSSDYMWYFNKTGDNTLTIIKKKMEK